MAKIVDNIITERLILRGINESDTDNIVSWRSDPDVYKYFKQPHKISAAEHNNWYNTSYLFNANRFDWMGLEKESSNRIGIFGLVREGNIAEINYILSPNAQHKGYAAEGVMSMIKYASANWNTHTIIAEIHKDNTPSLVFIKRLGFELDSSDGEFEIYKKEV